MAERINGRAKSASRVTRFACPPKYVKPFVKRQKNDAADAQAICEAAQRPMMRFIAVKSEEQQANAAVFRARDLLVRQRTQLINGLRGQLTEYGWIVAQGPSHVAELIEVVKDPASDLPQAVLTAKMKMTCVFSTVGHSSGIRTKT